MLNRKNLLIGGGILVGLYLLNPYSGSMRGQAADANMNFKSSDIKITNFVGKVELTTSPDNQIHIQTRNVKNGLVPNVDHIGNWLEISGSEDIDSIDCNNFTWTSFLWGGNKDDEFVVSINNQTGQKLDYYPILEIQAPKNINLTLDKMVGIGSFSDVNSVKITANSCGELDFADIEKNANFELRGSGDIKMGAVGGNVNATIRGSGNLSIGAVSGSASSDLRGSGNLNISSVAQDSDLMVQGSGNINIKQLSGIHKMHVQGSGNIDVDNIQGDVEILVQGSGNVDIDDGDLNWLIVNVKGSGNVDFDGVATNHQFKVNGSGEINSNYN